MCPSFVKRIPNLPHEDLRKKNRLGEEFDTLFIDFNGVVHHCSHPENGTPPETEVEMFERVFQELDRYINCIRPRKLLFIAVDGVCPVAKIVQQRKRRYCSARDSNGGSFDSNAITPGTPFMERLGVALHGYIINRMDRDLYWSSISVILSDSTVPGEGEHKIYEFLRKQVAISEEFACYRHCVYGMDADLIMLSLSVNIPSIKIIREDQTFPSKKDKCAICGKAHKTENHGKLEPLVLCDPHSLRVWIAEEAVRETKKTMETLDIATLVSDFVLITFLVGNDFLPKVPSVRIQYGGMEVLLKYYWPLVSEGKYLTHAGEINLVNLKSMFQRIASEEAGLLTSIAKTKRRDKEVLHYDAGLYYDTSKVIKIGQPGYHNRYYTVHFGEKNNTPEFAKELTRAYLEGIKWVYQYYMKGVPSWRWFYHYHFAPFAEDFANYMDTKETPEFEQDQPIYPIQQLFSVLPPQSFKNVPADIAHFVVSKESPVLSYFNTKFKTDINGENKLYKGVPDLDFIDEDKLYDAIKDKMRHVTGHTLRMNRVWGENILYIGPKSELYDFVPDFQSLHVEFHDDYAEIEKQYLSDPDFKLDPKSTGLCELDQSFGGFAGVMFPVIDSLYFTSPRMKYIYFDKGKIKEYVNNHIFTTYFRY